MAVKYSRSPVASVPAINNELQKIQVALEDAVSRKGDGPNQLEATVDANSQRIINLPEPVTNTEPVRKADFDELGNKLSSDVSDAIRDAENATQDTIAAINTAYTAANNANAAAGRAHNSADGADNAAAATLQALEDFDTESDAAIQSVINEGRDLIDQSIEDYKNSFIYYLTDDELAVTLAIGKSVIASESDDSIVLTMNL